MSLTNPNGLKSPGGERLTLPGIHNSSQTLDARSHVALNDGQKPSGRRKFVNKQTSGRPPEKGLTPLTGDSGIRDEGINARVLPQAAKIHMEQPQLEPEQPISHEPTEQPTHITEVNTSGNEGSGIGPPTPPVEGGHKDDEFPGVPFIMVNTPKGEMGFKPMAWLRLCAMGLASEIATEEDFTQRTAAGRAGEMLVLQRAEASYNLIIAGLQKEDVIQVVHEDTVIEHFILSPEEAHPKGEIQTTQMQLMTYEFLLNLALGNELLPDVGHIQAVRNGTVVRSIPNSDILQKIWMLPEPPSPPEQLPTK